MTKKADWNGAINEWYEAERTRQKDREEELRKALPNVATHLKTLANDEIIEEFKNALANCNCYYMEERKIWCQHVDTIQAEILNRMEH